MASGSQDNFDLLRECTLIARKWRTLYDVRIRKFGLTASRASVLYWLSELGGNVRQIDLAQTLNVAGPTLVNMLHLLQEQGLVSRLPDDHDDRVKRIALTDEGERLVRIIRALNIAIGDDVLRGLAPSKAVRLVRDLRSVSALLDRKNDP